MLLCNFQSPNFGCIKIKEGGMKFLEEEGIASANEQVEKAEEYFKDYKWKLSISKDGYSLTSPTTGKTHEGPFSIKKQIPKSNNSNEESYIIVRMDERNRVRYKVHFNIKEEVIRIYSKYKKSSSFEKMTILLKILEKNIISKVSKK